MQSEKRRKKKVQPQGDLLLGGVTNTYISGPFLLEAHVGLHQSIRDALTITRVRAEENETLNVLEAKLLYTYTESQIVTKIDGVKFRLQHHYFLSQSSLRIDST